MLIKQIEDLLDEFDFDKVKKVMDCLEWKYYNSTEEVSIGELRRMARRLLENVYNESASEQAYNGFTYTASGGFYAERQMFPGDATKYLSLKFVVTEWSNPCT
jgi:hypothetical protein